MAQTQRMLLVVSASLCLALLVWAGFRWNLRRVAAEQAVYELAACKRIAEEIKSYRASPPTALLAKQSDQQLLLAIQLAAQVAEIPDEDILRITPLHGRRRGKSDHIEQPTSVEIRKLTLGQLARFLGELSLLDLELHPTSIRLSAPRVTQNDVQTEFWGCDLVLTYLVFSPE